MQNQTKLIFFDFDGTLSGGCDFVFSHIWEYFDLDKGTNYKHIEDYKAGRITYADWVALDIEIFKAAKVTKSEMIKAFGRIYPNPGANETLHELKHRRFKIFIVSGGIDLLVYHLFPDWQNQFEDIFINKYIFDNKGNIQDGIATKYDFEHKATCIHDMAKKYQVPMKNTVFVGDNHNDVHAAGIAGTSIAFNCKSDQLREVATHHVESDDLRHILPLV